VDRPTSGNCLRRERGHEHESAGCAADAREGTDGRGAVVHIIDIPAEPGINGPDDYIGAHGAEAFFALTEDAGSAESVAAAIERLNKRFAIISVGNKVVVMDNLPDGSIKKLWPFEEFKKLLSKERITVAGRARSGRPSENEVPLASLRARRGQHARVLAHDDGGSGGSRATRPVGCGDQSASGTRRACARSKGEPMSTPDIPDLVSRLQQQGAAVGVARNALDENAARARATFHDTEQKLGLCIMGLTSTPRELEAEQALIAELEECRAIVLTKRTEIEQQIADAPDWRLAGDGCARDREYDRQQTLKQQLQLLRAGTLLFAPNQCYPRVEDLDARFAESNERIEKLRAQLAAHLQWAEVLLGEMVTG
jgi:hypothetical protein